MRIGFVVPYDRNEVTFTALRMADQFRSLGCDTTFLGRSVVDHTLRGQYDHELWPETKVPKHMWMQTCDRLVYFRMPPKSEITMAKAIEKPITLVYLWHKVDELDLDRLPEIEDVVCFHAAGQREISKITSKHAHYLPLDIGFATTRKRAEMNTGITWVHFPLHSHHLAQTDAESVFRVIRCLLQDNSKVGVLVTTGPGWSMKNRRTLKNMGKNFKARLQIKRKPDALDQFRCSVNCDLTAVPTLVDGLGYGVLESCTAGTPLIAWRIPPYDELLKQGSHAELVPVNVLRRSGGGFEGVALDWGRFLSTIEQTVKNPERMGYLRQAGRGAIDGRPEAFKRGCLRILAGE